LKKKHKTTLFKKNIKIKQLRGTPKAWQSKGTPRTRWLGKTLRPW
jgi:hypothetical protein